MVERENQGVQLIEKLLQRDDGVEDINKLCDVIRETSFEIHKFLRSGHLEKVYENALAHRLAKSVSPRSEEHTSELQSRRDLVCRLLLEKKKKTPKKQECRI